MAFHKKKKCRDHKHDQDDSPCSQAPLKYVAEEKVETKNAEFRITYDGEVIKESIPIFENGTAEELLLTVRDFNAMCESYELWANLNEANIYGKFRRCLKGDPRGSWDEVIDGEAKTEADFDTQIIDLIVGEIGMEAHKNQVKYLRRTKKLDNMPVQKWFKRIRFINRMLPFMQGGARAKNDVYMLENFIFENIPKDWAIQCELKGVNEDTSWTEVCAFLQTCEKYFKNENVNKSKQNYQSEDNSNENTSNTDESEKPDGRGNNSKKSGKDTNTGGINNPCKFPNHGGHDYKDCFNNPKSASFKGKALTIEDFDKADKKIKEEAHSYDASFSDDSDSSEESD